MHVHDGMDIITHLPVMAYRSTSELVTWPDICVFK